jgi:NAD(P)-dependent dehydrogenase (short-subunit alcohol dehydrogenase family)
MSEAKVAIVTGSSRGIGKGIALSLAAAGWRIVINYHSNNAAAKAAKEEVEALGGEGLIVQADMGNIDSFPALVDAAVEAFGRIDLLVNNAGVGPRERVDMLEVGVESYDHVMGINLRGPFFLTQLVANRMIEMSSNDVVKFPKIINISSISAYTSSPARAEYCISKAGMGMLTTLWADRLAEYGINVYEIRPGIIKTDLTSGVKEKYDRLILDEGVTPIRRWGLPEDIGKAVVAIASDMLPFSTGEVINVDGGFHISRL